MEPSVSIASIRDQVARLREILEDHATYKRFSGEAGSEYIELRNVLRSDLQICELLPNFVNE